MTDHPSSEELSALLRGTVSGERQREILRHLLSPCPPCLAAAPPPLAILLGYEPASEAVEEDADYEKVFDRVLSRVHPLDKHLQEQRRQAKRLAERFARDGLKAVAECPREMGTLARMEALLTTSWSLRHKDPELMVQFAWLAVQCSLQLDKQRYGASRVSDFQCRALAEMSNAQRVLDQLEAAESTMMRARRLFELGTRSKFLEVRLLELEASLFADRRRFGEACLNLEKVYRFHLHQRDHHLAGRALVKQGLYRCYACDYDQSLFLLKKSLTLIDKDRDPGLAYAAMHNILTLLVDTDQFQEAEKQLFQLRPLQQHAGGQINDLRFRWEEARIDTGLGRYKRAEARLDEIREAFLELNRAYDSALASLDLAAALLAQKKAGKATEVVSAAYRTFMALDIQREALVAISLLKTACEVREATKEMAEEVARFLRRFANDPKARFKGKSWEQV